MTEFYDKAQNLNQESSEEFSELSDYSEAPDYSESEYEARGGREHLMRDFQEIVSLLESRWPETKIEPSLDRISRLMAFLGDPQFAYPVIQITGTNGKTSTARMIESLLREMGLNTGLTTSPHLHLLTERIQLNGQPVSIDKFVSAYDEIEPYLAMVDSESMAAGGPPMSYFEVLVGLAFSIFADAPIDVAVVEVGMGGTWDATSVTQPAVSVVTPIGMDHVEILGPTIEDIAREKSGIIKPGSIAVLGDQVLEVAQILAQRAIDVSTVVARQGVEFKVVDRNIALGGQVISIEGVNGLYDDIFLPLHGVHMASNAAIALAAVEAFFGGTRQLNIESVRSGFAAVTSPARLEIMRRDPTVIIDAAHNPHGAAILALALQESFTFDSIIGVISVMGDKDVPGVLQELEPVLKEVVITTNGMPRAMPVDDLAILARDTFGLDRVHVVAKLSDAIDRAVQIADDLGTSGIGVVVTGSVVTAARARALLGRAEV